MLVGYNIKHQPGKYLTNQIEHETKVTFCQIRGSDCFLSVCDEADEGLCWWRGCQIATEKTESGPVSPLPLFSLLSSPAMARRLRSSQTVFHPGVLKTTHFPTFNVFISFTKK